MLDPGTNLKLVYELLKAMVESGRLILYAGDCPFEDLWSVLSKEEHFTYYSYLLCTNDDCGEIYMLAICIRSSVPIFEKVDNIDEKNLEKYYGAEKACILINKFALRRFKYYGFN
ncbi:MAG: hypothetical protein K2G56_00870 [Eubacterium sp.]|nr:hypothetical protein [Eubacterium sp.]